MMPYGLMMKVGAIAIVCGLAVFACNRRDAGIREAERNLIFAEAAENAEANRLAAAALDAARDAERLAEMTALKVKLKKARDAAADSCSEATALPDILEALR